MNDRTNDHSLRLVCRSKEVNRQLTDTDNVDEMKWIWKLTPKNDQKKRQLVVE